MGKIRIKTIGSEEEQEEKKKAKARAEAKKIEAAKKAAEATKVAGSEEQKATAKPVEESPEKKKTKKYSKSPKSSQQKHSKNYLTIAANVDKNKTYALSEALTLLIKFKREKFDETVELHINTTDKGISGQVTLPHGTGKQTRVVVANQGENPKHVEELIKNVESGKIDFDVLIATPDTMPKLARVARILGPRGLMPNPKNGTVTPKPDDVAKRFQGGQINFKTESKFPLLHMAVGKISFGEKKLAENIKTAVAAIQLKNIKNTRLKSTMSPSIKIESASL